MVQGGPRTAQVKLAAGVASQLAVLARRDLAITEPLPRLGQVGVLLEQVRHQHLGSHRLDLRQRSKRTYAAAGRVAAGRGSNATQVQARFDPSRHVVRYDALWEQRRRRWNAVLNERIEGRGRRLLDFVRVSVRRL